MSFPLMFASPNQKYKITKVLGSEALTKHLRDLGFIDGAVIEIKSIDKGGVTIKIHDTKLALDCDICNKIFLNDIEKVVEDDEKSL